MKLLALALCAGFTYTTYKLYLSNNIAVLPVGIFTLFTYWLYYETTKFTKT
jgi:hypothetical protein